jgi:hypothetical protein
LVFVSEYLFRFLANQKSSRFVLRLEGSGTSQAEPCRLQSCDLDGRITR